MLQCGGNDLTVGLAIDQAVFVLHADEGVSAQLLRDPQRIHHVPGGEIRTTDMAHLAALDQVVERTQRFLDGRAMIGRMKLIKVDPVGAEPLQAVLDSAHDIVALGALPRAALVHRKAELGGDHDLLAARAERTSEQFFRRTRLAPGINVGDVEHGDTHVHGGIDHADRGVRVETAAQIIATETED